MNKKNFQIFEALLSSVMLYFKWIVGLAVVMIFLSGIYQVDSKEIALVFRFGRLCGSNPESRIKHPGLHFSFPYLIDDVIKIPVGKVQDYAVVAHYHVNNTITSGVRDNGYVITGDSNIVHIKTVVKYRITDPVSLVVNHPAVTPLIDGIIASYTTDLVSRLGVDDILTTGKAVLARELQELAQKELDRVNAGIKITSIEFTNILPPNEIRSEFEAVNAAKIEKETIVQRSKDMESRQILDAESKAEALIQNAHKQRSEKIAQARDRMAEFEGMYHQYTESPEVIKDSIFRSRVANIINKMGTTIVTPDKGKTPGIILK